MLRIANFEFRSGSQITCRIKDELITNARIFFDSRSLNSETKKAWICHDKSEFNGDESPNLLGFKYSWVFFIEQIPGGDYATGDVVSEIRPILPGNIQAKHNCIVSSDLISFFKINQLDTYMYIFDYKLGIFDEFNQYEVSKSLNGYLVLKNENKSMDIKFGRFFRQMVLKFNEAVSKSALSKLEITEKLVETLHNKFVSFQKGDSCLIKFLSGNDILKGYTRQNYFSEDGGTLHKSCMTDKINYLKLYTDNPNKVKLAVIHIEDKIAARCLVWTATDGKQYSDRVYYRYDWLEDFMKEKLRKQGIDPVDEQGIRIVQLDKWEFESYPYVDHFYHMDKKTGTLLSLCSKDMKVMRNTNGTID